MKNGADQVGKSHVGPFRISGYGRTTLLTVPSNNFFD